MSENEDVIKEKKKKIQEDKDYTSNKISDLSRYIGFGVLAVIFALLTSRTTIGEQLSSRFRWLTVLIVFFGIATIFLDYFQYLFGYYASQRASRGEIDKYTYNKEWSSYKLRGFCFWGKQYTAVIGGILLVIAITYCLFA